MNGDQAGAVDRVTTTERVAIFERELRVDASLSEVWSFHSTIHGLQTLIPRWAGLRVESIDYPTEDRASNALVPGTRIHLSVQPFGAGPRVRWQSEIVAREKGDGTAYFVDEMVDGPLPEWRHMHLFYGDGDETLLRDRVEYRAPGAKTGAGATVANAVLSVLLGVAFRYRHRRTRETLE